MVIEHPSNERILRVVMPVHNAARFVGAALASVLSDLPAGSEVVVVDDGSTDGSRQIVRVAAERDPRVKLLENKRATGVSNALNAGITVSGCPPFVAVAEHDDLVLPGRFAAQLAELNSSSRLGAVSGEGRYLGPTGRTAGRVSVGPKSTAEFEQMREQGREILIPHPAIMYRRDAILEAGLYDTTFDAAQDLEIVNRLVYAEGWEVRTLAEPHVLYRIHDSSMSFSHIATQRLITRYIRYRNSAQLNGLPFVSFPEWRLENVPDRRTRWRWYRKDTGALRFRRAGLAWLNRQPFSFAGNLVAATVLHPRWVLMKLKVARGR